MNSRIPFRRCVVVGVGALAMFLSPGCISIQPPRALRGGGGVEAANRPERPSGAGERVPGASSGVASGGGAHGAGSIWPARWGAAGSPRGAIVACADGPGKLRSAHLGRFHTLRLGDLEYAHAEALAKAVGKDEGFRFEAEGPGSLVFLPPMEVDDDAETKPEPDAPAETVVFVSGSLLEGKATDDEERVALQRTWISCYDAYPRAEDAVGTIVLVPGMLGTPEPIIDGMIRYWRRAGFSVVRLLSHPSRFTERLETAMPEGHESEVGAYLAGLYDDRTAECAYAADAGLTHWLGARPGLADRPVVYVGMSGGAIVGPAVVEYRPGRYDAAVLIAGGVDFFSISATSNYADWIDAITLDWSPEDPDSLGKPTPERLERAADAYLAASKLDAMHRAPNIGVPALVLHAGGDKAVPSRYGETLWERLGRPERWVFPVGHELIFVMLPTQAERMDAWIKRAVGLTGDAGDPGAGAP